MNKGGQIDKKKALINVSHLTNCCFICGILHVPNDQDIKSNIVFDGIQKDLSIEMTNKVQSK